MPTHNHTPIDIVGPMKLQKFLSTSGVCSRRKAEEYIRDGAIKVNGELAHIGQVIDPSKDTVQYGDTIIKDQQNLVYYAFNKPRGVVTSCADTHETDILDVVDIPERVFPVGRLDKNTTGLVILTNDGRITHRLLHPSFDHQKEYIVEVYGKIEDEELRTLERGVNVLGKKTKTCEIVRISTGTFSMTLTEGRNRQIRRMVQAIGHEVKKLKRVRVENIQLGKLPIGSYKALTHHEIETLFERIGMSSAPTTDHIVPQTHHLDGVIVHGDGLGKKMGFPTANIEYMDDHLEDATYYVRAKIDGHTYDAAGIFLPWKGTFEVHILDFDADIYGKNMHVDILDKIRDNKKFDDVKGLTDQIQKDITVIRNISDARS